MDVSAFFAQLLGLYLIVVGVSMHVKRKMLVSIVHEIADNRALSYGIGMLTFLAGLIIVLQHTVLFGIVPTTITIIGWGIMIEGASYLFLSKRKLKKILSWIDNQKWYNAAAIVYILLGVYFAYSGFWVL